MHISAHTKKIYTKAGGNPFHKTGWLKAESIGKLSKNIPMVNTSSKICPIFFTDLATILLNLSKFHNF